MIALTAPFTQEKVRALKVGDMVAITGTLYTGRDAFHKYLHDGGEPPVPLLDQIIYHCGPVVVREGDAWQVRAAGPTTSIREEPYQGDILRKFGVRAVIGKGGMGPKTLAACQEVPGVYLHAIGGAASLIAQSVTRVLGVYKLDFGVPEAMWVTEIEDFPVVVTMDAHGNSLHATVEELSRQKLEQLLAKA
jgi:fumarate hydratase class I